MESKALDQGKFSEFEVLFAKLQEAGHSETVQKSETISKESDPIVALAEATMEIDTPRFTTYVSS